MLCMTCLHTLGVCQMSAEPAHTVVKRIKAEGGKALAFPGSVTEAAFPAAIFKAGPQRLLYI